MGDLPSSLFKTVSSHYKFGIVVLDAENLGRLCNSESAMNRHSHQLGSFLVRNSSVLLIGLHRHSFAANVKKAFLNDFSLSTKIALRDDIKKSY